MKRNKLKLLGIIAAVAVIGFSMVGCDNGNGNGGGGGGARGVGPALVGVWEGPSYTLIKFDADGWTNVMGDSGTTAGYVGTSGNRVNGTGGSEGLTGGFDFVLDGGTMTVSNASGAFAGLNGTWTRQ